MTRRIIQTFLVVTISFIANMDVSAQFSISSSWAYFDYNEPLDANNTTSQFQLELGYWFRLKKIRLEFHPSALYNTSDVKFNQRLENIGFALPMNVYPLDFINDCDCPTFSKHGQWAKKAFYFQLKPQAEFELEQDVLTLSTALLAGLDLGLSDLLTISPSVGYNYYFTEETFPERPDGPIAQLRLILRPDYVRKRY